MSASPVIPDHHVDALLGAGTTASVWRARTRDGAEVAVKVADPEPVHVATVRAEAALLARLDHPGVVRARALVETPSTVALVLDLVPGGTLADRLARRTRLTPAEVVELGTALARTLEHLHRRGVVHGDVKPHNVLLDADGRPVLCDLGAAAAPVVTGTPGYAAPEVVDGTPPGPAADVRGLAVVLHEALAGRRPHPGIRLAQAAPGAPPRLLSVIERALTGAIDSAAALAAGLAAVGAELAPRTDTRTFGPRPPRPEPDVAPRRGDRARRIAPVAAAAAVAALLAGPLSTWKGPDAAAASDRLRLVSRPAVTWDGAVLTAEDGTRYTLGVTGGEVVLGDWDCDGRQTPAHYDPESGSVVLFPDWASRGAAVGGDRLRREPGGAARVARVHGCDRLVVVDRHAG